MTTSGLGLADRRLEPLAVQGVADDRGRAMLVEPLRAVVAAGQADDVVPGGDELLDQRAPDGPGGSREEDPHCCAS